MVGVRGEWFVKAHRSAKAKSHSILRAMVRSLDLFSVEWENTAVSLGRGVM